MRLFTTLLALVVSVAAVAPARASEKELIQFLQSSDGLWRGSGIYRATRWNGSRVETSYTLSSEYNPEPLQTWLVKNQVQTQSGYVSNSNYRLKVVGDALYIGYPSPLEVVTIVTSTVDSLTYRLVRVDTTVVPARVFTYTYENRIRANRAGDRILIGRSTVESNGVLVADDQYTLDNF